MTTQQPILSAENLSVGYRNGRTLTVVASGISLSLRRGELVALLGANGTGKSTLLRTLSGVQPPLSGSVLIDGQSLAAISQRRRSRLISIVYTDRTLAGALTVTELVSLGRQPYTGFFGRLDRDDLQIVEQALEAVGIAHKAADYVATLSDGERQKAMIARALAQEAPIIILDEPTTFLDVASRLDTMTLLSQLASRHDKAIVLSTHDISAALTYASRLWLLDRSGVITEGPTDCLIADGSLNAAFASERITFSPTLRDFVAVDTDLSSSI